MLKDKYPDLAKYWDYERNRKMGLLFENVSTHSGKKAWWICKKGHEWEAKIYNVANRQRCPYCAKEKKNSK